MKFIKNVIQRESGTKLNQSYDKRFQRLKGKPIHANNNAPEKTTFLHPIKKRSATRLTNKRYSSHLKRKKMRFKTINARQIEA